MADSDEKPIMKDEKLASDAQVTHMATAGMQ
jgi:hypothetical protein